MNVDNYLKRIKYQGPKNATVEVLKQLHYNHLTNIPYDTTSLFGGRRKTLNINVIYDNIVNKNQGGFCFELNGLFHWLLSNLGFQVKIVEGSEFDETNDGFGAHFGHLVLMVEFAGCEQWLADVGWGGTSVAYPIRFENVTEHVEKSGIYRIRRIHDQNEEFHVLEKRRQKYINNDEELNRALPCSESEVDNSKWQVLTWQVLFRFYTKPYKLQDFAKKCSEIQIDKSGFHSQWYLIKHTDNGRLVMTNKIYYEREYLDPLTIAKNYKLMVNDENVYDIIKQKFGFNIDFKFTK